VSHLAVTTSAAVHKVLASRPGFVERRRSASQRPNAPVLLTADAAECWKAPRTRICAAAEDGEPRLHGRDFRLLAGDDLLREPAHERISARNQYEPSHLHRALMVRNHQRKKVYSFNRGVACNRTAVPAMPSTERRTSPG
jgi:hypothetical protein